jgi:PPM family protein phosphatase
MESFTIMAGSRSVKGPHRSNNEDYVSVDASAGLFLLADGIGGHAGGEHASALGVRTVQQAVLSSFSSGNAVEDPEELIRASFMQANRAIFDEGIRTQHLAGMGTTLVLLLLRAGYAYVAGLGDSRAYHVRENQITQLTEDHSFGSNLLVHHLGRTTQAPPVVRSLPLMRDDRFLLMSDGLHGVVDDPEILHVTASPLPASSVADQLVWLALGSGSRDNVSCVAVQVE